MARVQSFKSAKLQGVEMVAFAKTMEEWGARRWGTRHHLLVTAISNYTGRELRGA
jgi:hypothetical protein